MAILYIQVILCVCSQAPWGLYMHFYGEHNEKYIMFMQKLTLLIPSYFNMTFFSN